MNIFKRFFTKPEETRSGQFQNFTMPFSDRSVLITPVAAENLSSVMGCVTAISSALASLPTRVYQNAKKERLEAFQHPFAAIVKRGPNEHQPWPDFIEFVMAQVLLHGNALIEIKFDRATGEITGLTPHAWPWVQVQILPNGRLVYDVYPQPGVYGYQGQRKRLLAEDVIHLKDRTDDGLIGKSRLQRCLDTLRGVQNVNQFASAAFEKGFYPSGVIYTEALLNSEQRNMLHDAFSQGFSGPQKAGKAFVLDQGLKWESLQSLSPEAAETLNSRKFGTEEVCRIFQVPPPIIQDYSHNTFTNSEQAGRWFGQFCLLPWVTKLEATFNRALFPASDYELEIDMSAFDRGDSESRWQAHEIAAKNQILTIDEIREIEGWNPKNETTDTPA